MFWRGVFGYLPVQVTDAAVGLGAVYAFTRLLTPEQYGHYALAFSVAAIVQILFLVWTEAAMERFHAGALEAGEARDHLATIHRTFAAVAGAGVVAVCVLLLAVRLDPDLERAIGCAAGSTLASSALKLVQLRRRAEGRVAAYAVTSIGCNLAGFVLGVWAALAGWGGAAPFVGFVGASVVGLVLSWPGQFAMARGGRFQADRARGYVGYGLPVSLSLLLATLLATTDRFLIGAFIDEATVGAYHAGYSLSNRTLDILFIWLGMAGAPALVAALERSGPDAMRRAARLQAEVMVLVGLPAAVGLALVARPFADLLLGEGLRETAVRVMPWIAAGGFLAGLTTHYLRQAFTLARKTGLMLLAMAVPASANVVLNLVLIPRFGLDGAMWATTASFALGAVVFWGIGRAVTPLPMPLEAGFRAGLACAAMAVVVTLLPAWGGAPELALKAVAGAATYALALLLLEAVAPGRATELLRETRPWLRLRRPAVV